MNTNFRCSKISKVSPQPQVSIVIKAHPPNSSIPLIITKQITISGEEAAIQHTTTIGVIIITITTTKQLGGDIEIMVLSQETSLLCRNIPISMVKTNPSRCLIIHKEEHQALTIQ